MTHFFVPYRIIFFISRIKYLQLFLIDMTQYLPPNLLALFAARDPIPYLPPVGKLTWEKKTDGYSGVAHLIGKFEVSCIFIYVL